MSYLLVHMRNGVHLIMTEGTVIAVCRSANPGLPKPRVDAIHLLANLGVEGDYHCGKFVRHRSIARKYPELPNTRQVLIADAATYDELASKDILLEPGMLGENITVSGLSVMQLPVGTLLAVGSALVEVTEVRHACYQLNGIDARLLKAVVERDGPKKVYKAGIMTRVALSGWVRPGETITVVEKTESDIAVPC
jgi:hypothetical protein